MRCPFACYDVQADGFGEARWGAARGAQTSMMIAAGTGIGGAVIAHGKLVRGNHGFAGEIGHIACSQAVGIPCVCGGAGTWSWWLPAAALRRAMQKRAASLLTAPRFRVVRRLTNRWRTTSS